MNLIHKEKIALKAIVLLCIVVTLAIFSLDPIAQPTIYHNLSDQNTYFAIPNFLNVASNIAFIIVGILGLYHLFGKNCKVLQDKQLPYCIFFIGVTLVGFGSGYYHLWPDNTTLIWDRLPISLAFMALFTLVVAEFISEKLALRFFYPLILLGFLSVIYWAWSESHGHGDLRPYILVQLLPILIIPIILLVFKSSYSSTQGYWILLGSYALGKLLEYFDKEVYDLLGFISGHTLKHLVVATGIYLLLYSFKKRKLVLCHKK